MKPILYREAEEAKLTSMKDISNMVDTDISPEYIAGRAMSKLDAAFISFEVTGLFLRKNKNVIVIKDPEEPEILQLVWVMLILFQHLSGKK